MLPEHQAGIMAVWVIIIGLFLGFMFQGLTKLERIRRLDNRIWDRVRKDNEKIYQEAEKIMKKSKLIETGTETRTVFDLMHNYLWGRARGKAPTFFSMRVAFWSNIYFGTLILSVIAFFQGRLLEMLMPLLVMLHARWLYKEYLRILYDVVLKTFIAIHKLQPS